MGIVSSLAGLMGKSASGTSASSDAFTYVIACTIRCAFFFVLTDPRIQVFNIHNDSIWSLHTNAAFSHLYSGGRDGVVFHTNLATRASSLLLKESSPILALAGDQRLLESSDLTGMLWVGTTQSHVHGWSVPSLQESKSGEEPMACDMLVV